MQRAFLLAQFAKQIATCRRVMRLSGRQSESYGRSIIRGNQMNLGGPTASGFADGLWTVFLMRPFHLDAP
jgi:hypothetical protein